MRSTFSILFSASKTDDSRSNRSGSSHSTQESKREEKVEVFINTITPVL